VILVFARAPLPGRAKTRLAPLLGEWRAARLQARLTLRALRTALASGCGAVELHAAPAGRHGFFVFLERRFHLKVRNQKGADLGQRMSAAIERALRRHRAAILIGSDCPALKPGDLRRAARWLRGGCDAVLAPAEDGGYALIGMRRPVPQAFLGIDWGTAAVFEQTRSRLVQAGARWRALRTLWDLDRPQDMARLGRLPLTRATGQARGAC
jgi:rSAM/selenodomain-associated transferase 1